MDGWDLFETKRHNLRKMSSEDHLNTIHTGLNGLAKEICVPRSCEYYLIWRNGFANPVKGPQNEITLDYLMGP